MKGEKKNYISIDEVKTWDENPREISPKDFESLKKKIERWGIWKPFLVWESKKQILGGNQRYKACKELGHKEIWVEYREPKDDAEALEMAIADNESSGEWIKSLLIEQIKLNEDKIDLENYKVNLLDYSLSELLLEEKEPEELEGDFKNNKPQILITFENKEDLDNAKIEIERITERYSKSYLSVKGGEF